MAYYLLNQKSLTLTWLDFDSEILPNFYKTESYTNPLCFIMIIHNIMKNTYLIILIILFSSCNKENSITESDKIAFEKTAQNYQSIYMDGGKNCEQILATLDENIEMWESGKVWTLNDLKKFCSHLPTKKVIKTYHNQKLLSKELGYDYVSQLYISQTEDTLRETASRIWRKTDENWKIIKMNNLIKKE